jgi:HAT1-interacting factor 1
MTETNGHQQATESTESHQSVSANGSYSPQVLKEIQLGHREYALKNYEKAVEHYGQASELQYAPQSIMLTTAHKNQAQMTQISYFHMERRYSKSHRKTAKSLVVHPPRIHRSVVFCTMTLMADPKRVLASAAEAATGESETKVNPKISFSGDAEDEEDDEEEEGEEEEKEDDFQIAWEVLETAKLLYEKELESRKGKNVSGKGSEEDTSLERKIADVCDLLGEVSIENGKFFSKDANDRIL